VDFGKYEQYKDNLNKSKDIIWVVEEFYGLTNQEDVT